jgi:hypothetical protein
LLLSLPFDRNSDDFVFDNQIIAQAVMVGASIGELSCPTRYDPDSSSINFRRSVHYGFGVLQTAAQYRLHVHGTRHYSFLEMPEPQSSDALVVDFGSRREALESPA